MNKFKDNKLFSLLIAASSVIIIAGIILYALLGFNTLPDRPKSYTFEVRYDVTVELAENGEENLAKICEDAFAKYNLSYVEKDFVPYVDDSSLNETSNSKLIYTFNANTDTEALGKAAEEVTATASAEYELADIYAGWNALESERFYEFAWRGAIAVAVGAIVAFIYITVRYGVSLGVAGLACCAHDALFTAAFFAVTRIPVYAAAPLLYAAIAALVSIVLWLIFANKLRAAFKNPENEGVSSEELITNTSAASKKTILVTAAVICGVIVILGAVAWSGASLFVIPAIVGVAVPVYSTLLIGPGVCTPIRKAFDKRRAAKKVGYTGKKKNEKADAE